MSFRTTWRLFLAVVLMALLVWVSRKKMESRSRDSGLPTPVLPRMQGEVCALVLEREGFSIECKKENGKWWIRRPILSRADEEEVLRILSVLEGARRLVTVRESEYKRRELTLADYGLAPPRMRFVVEHGIGRYELLVGRESPLGDMVYVKLSDEADIAGTSLDLLAAMPANVEVLRSRVLLEGEVGRVFRVEIRRGDAGGFIQLMRTGNTWSIQQPLIAPADNGRIQEMLETLFGMRVSRFVWDPPIREEKPTGSAEKGASIGLQDAVNTRGLVPEEDMIRVSIWLQGDDKRQEIILEKPTSENSREIYARRGDEPSLYAVDRRIFEVFSITVNDVRDRALFASNRKDVTWIGFDVGSTRLVLEKSPENRWKLTSPVEWRAEDSFVEEVLQKILRLKITSFVDVAPTNLAEIGLQPPALVVGLKSGVAARCSGGSTEGETMFVGKIREGSPFVYVRRVERSGVYEVGAEDVSWLCNIATNPLVFLDRTVLSLPRQSVKRISLLKGGITQTVQLDDHGQWRVVEPVLHAVAGAVVEDILLYVENLRAVNIESLQATELRPYGLDHPRAVLTLGLSPEKGIQKSLLVGAPAGDRGFFAMIHGQNVVFVLPAQVANLLVRDVVAPVNGTEPHRQATEKP
ncbi:MAG: DUF4340 domain-containing protein [Kiritimatiellae bacterium]|nr:DUF4340 domain-containing protein [Kiritimatiellia bacterium]